MAGYVDNLADPPDWADTVTEEVIKTSQLGPVDPDLAASLDDRYQPEAT